LFLACWHTTVTSIVFDRFYLPHFFIYISPIAELPGKTPDKRKNRPVRIGSTGAGRRQQPPVRKRRTGRQTIIYFP
jgi:hypothetical protein